MLCLINVVGEPANKYMGPDTKQTEIRIVVLVLIWKYYNSCMTHTWGPFEFTERDRLCQFFLILF